MSIIYEYLQLLEKKKKQNTPQPNAPVPDLSRKKRISAPFYFMAGFFILACVLILFLFRNIKETGPREAERATTIPQNLNFVSHDFPAREGFGSYKAYDLEYTLKGIIYNSESPSAIINSQLVEKNGKIDDWQVMEISPSEVKLENSSNKSLLTLKLNSSSGQ